MPTYTSTSTLLDVMNRVLLDIGEIRVAGLTTPVAEKARDYIQIAYRDVIEAYEWDFLRDKITATTWVGNTATLSNTKHVHDVTWYYNNGQGYTTEYPLRFIDEVSFNRIYPQAFSSVASTAYRPNAYTVLDSNTVRINPYPTNSEGQSLVFFYISKTLPAPAATNNFFQIPEEYLDLVRFRAGAMLARLHAEDDATAGYLNAEYENRMRKYRLNRDRTPSNTTNLYKSRYRSFRYY